MLLFQNTNFTNDKLETGLQILVIGIGFVFYTFVCRRLTYPTLIDINLVENYLVLQFSWLIIDTSSMVI